jgi:hypothetical protein
MSDFGPRLGKWRDQGSLRYLARELDVTTKQVTRYWDNGCIDGCYQTPKGHRRIRYTDSTVENVALMVRRAKEWNVRIRYHLTQIDYRGTIIPVKGCNSTRDLYRRARKAGLSKREARDVAYTPDIEAPPSPEQIAWDSLLALNRTYGEEVLETMRAFSLFPLHFLLQASDSEDFRARAKTAWQKLDSFFESREELRPLSSNDQKAKDAFQKLLSQPDLPSFISAWRKETELQYRVFETNAETYKRAKEQAEKDPGALRLATAALTLRRKQQTPSARALAEELGMSRPALYRAFKSHAIQEALNLVRNDPQAIQESRNDKTAKGQKRRRSANEQGK